MSVARFSKPTNDEIAKMLERIADLLEAQSADFFRVRAYRSAAETVRRHRQTIAALAEDVAALERLPTIGQRIARTIAEFVRSGHAGVLDRLEGEQSVERQFSRIPGIGEKLAARIYRDLHIETLDVLALAAHDGRLAALPGIGPRRALPIARALDSRLRRRRIGRGAKQQGREPSVAQLLEVDEIYRGKVAAGELKLIAPKRFNPQREAWLPIMHLELDGWSFTALFSNTERAHQLGKTRDWVVIFYESDLDHGQATVVSEGRGELEGRRVVRGWEEECLLHYRRSA